MTRLATLALVCALLSGCATVPRDFCANTFDVSECREDRP